MQKPLISISLVLAGRGSVLASVQIAGNLSRNQTVKPGEVVEGSVLVKNHGSEPAQINITQAHHESLSDEGVIRVGGKSASAPPRNLLIIEPSEFRLEAEESIRVRYRCQTPAERKLKGTYWGVAILERITAANLAPAPEQSEGRRTGTANAQSSRSEHRRAMALSCDAIAA